METDGRVEGSRGGFISTRTVEDGTRHNIKGGPRLNMCIFGPYKELDYVFRHAERSGPTTFGY